MEVYKTLREAEAAAQSYFTDNFKYDMGVGIESANGMEVEFYPKEDPGMDYTYSCYVDDGYHRSCKNGGEVKTVEMVEEIKRPYGHQKTASLPGGRITKQFKDELKEWSRKLGISQVKILEFAFDNYVAHRENFIHCDVKTLEEIKRPYGHQKTASLPGGRITKQFKDELKECSRKLGISQVKVLEFAFDNYVAHRENFIHCDNCKEPMIPVEYITVDGLLLHKCDNCGYENKFETRVGYGVKVIRDFDDKLLESHLQEDLGKLSEFEEFKTKEFVGDSLLRFIVATLLVERGIHRNNIGEITSNANLVKANQLLGLGAYEFDYSDRPQKRLANNYEYHVYLAYQKGGIDKATDFIKNSLIKLYDEGKLS